MNVLDAEFVRGFMRMADDGWRQGWHERNDGNLSYRMKTEDAEAVRANLNPGEWKPVGTSVPKLAGEHFLVTGSGKYFRNVTVKPEDSFCIIELDAKGENYRICWGLVNGGRPTSELPSHLMNHEVKVIAMGGKHRVIYHAHPANTIALTFVLPLTDEAFTRELWEMATECPVVFPDGVGVVPWMVPGGRDIAVATSELMKKIRCGNLGAPRDVLFRRGFRPDFRPHAHRGKVRGNSGESSLHDAAQASDHPARRISESGEGFQSHAPGAVPVRETLTSFEEVSQNSG